jgi:integrase
MAKMTTRQGGRPATGSIRWRLNQKHVDPATGAIVPTWMWFGRVELADGSRPFVPLDPNIPAHDEERARACAITTRQWFRANPQGDATIRETIAEWFGRFHAHKERLGLSTVAEMRGRYRKWVHPEIGAKAPRAVTREDLEKVVRRLDKAVATWTRAGGKRGQGISPSTAANIWGDLVHAFDEAVRSKDPGLRVLTANPCAEVRGPDAGDDRTGQILYSDELLALLRGVPTDAGADPVPLYRRQAYALAVYTKGRAGELEAIAVADVDLAHCSINVDKQTDRKSKGRLETKRTKTKKKRTIDIEPNVLPLVEALTKRPAGKRGRLLHMPPPEDRAELLRKDLLTVGVRRKSLHESDELERAITFHDLRDTGLTHMAVRGDHPLVIQWTAGHTDRDTTDGYLERARVERQRIGDPLPPLPPDLLPDVPDGLDPGWDQSELDAPNFPFSLGNTVTPTGIEPVLPT